MEIFNKANGMTHVTGKIQTKMRPSDHKSRLAQLLQLRGFRILECNPNDQLLTSSLADDRVIAIFYHQLSRYSFRLFLRELIETQNHIQPATVSRYCSLKVAVNYLDFLVGLNLLQPDGEKYKLTAEFVPNFGETLEWYIAEIFKREFAAEAVYRVTLAETKIGGDHDVLADCAGNLVFVEVKSSPPKGVDHHQVRLFFNHVSELLPNLAIFLEDTHLRMKDKIVSLFQDKLARQFGAAAENYPVRRLQEELFHINHCIFIVNSKHGLMRNIKVCLRDYLRNQLNMTGMPLLAEVILNTVSKHGASTFKSRSVSEVEEQS